MADIFISYAREDRSRIEPLAKSLENLGWSVFWDRTIPAGKTWRQVIGDALKNARSVIVAWSKDSIDSDWVQEEADKGRSRNVLIPVFIDNVDPPLGFGAIQAADLTGWNPAQSSPEFEKLISDISIILGTSPKQIKEAEKAAEQERNRKEAEEEARVQKVEAERKTQEEHKRKKEEERRKAEETRRLEEEQKRAEAERKAEEERKRREIEAKHKGEEERKHKQAEEAAERAKKEHTERKAEPGKSLTTKIEVSISVALVIVVGAIMLFWQEPPRLGPDISAPSAQIEEPQKAPEPAGEAPKPEAPAPDTKAAAPAVNKEPPIAIKPSEISPSKKFTNSIGMEFVLIPAGSFTMGSNSGDNDEKPAHDVKISQSFYLQTTEVSQGQWKKVMGDNPSYFKQCGEDCPVEQVSWDDVQRFIEKLNHLERTKAYRLSSEAEWEYACRAGTTTLFSFGNDESKLGEYAWYSDNAKGTTHRVASKKSNPWGLYDMHGNVWEWVEDDYHPSYEGGPFDGSAWFDDPRRYDRVLRSGCMYSSPQNTRSASRSVNKSSYDKSSGFRVAKSP